MSGYLNGDAQLTHLRLDLFRNGYQPVPVSSPIPQHPTAGKAPFVTGWRTICATANEQDIAGWTDRYRDHGNTGILTGRVAGVDIDVPAAALADKISHLADALLGQTTLRRVGNAPKSLRCYRVSSPLQKIETPELFLTDGMKVQVEVLGEGQQFVAHGMHPVTGRPYAWLEASPELLPLSDVPIVSEDSLRTFVAASEAILRAAGGRTKKELEKEQKEAAGANKPKPEAGKTSAESSDSNFFRVVNQRGLADIGPWFTAIFPTARREAGTGAWRVSSADIGRGLEEDISIHPVNGGRDFGTEESCSPIDVVIKHGGAADPVAAALFICEKLAVDPAGIGWKSKGRKADRPKPDARDHDGLPTIQVTAGHLHTITTAAEQAILKAGISIYQRGGDLMRPATSEVPASSGRITTTAVLADVTAHALIDIFSSVARWQKFDARADDWVAANPPKQVAEILLSRFGHWKLPQVAGIITTPTMRPDGSILSAPGYDPATRLYHAADSAVVLMRQALEPTRDVAIRALKVLRDLLSEFPFVSEVSKSVALSALITPVVRGALSVAPLHAFRATTAGTGKSYLADIASAISSGRPCPVTAAGADETEMEKRLTGLLLAGYPIACLDNVNGELGGDLLCQAIERPFIRLRPLGSSRISEIESRVTLYATGNGLRVRGDMVRRTILADLDAGLERPELRSFRADPVATVLANRGRYVSACLCVVRAYVLAPQPARLPSIASFSDWSGTVRSALVWLGCADPADSMEQARGDDPELTDLRDILACWYQAMGTDPTTCRSVIDVAEEKIGKANENGDIPKYAPLTEIRYPGLLDALTRIAGVRGSIDANRLGRWLLGCEGRVVGGQKFRRDGVTGGATRWRIDGRPVVGGA